MHFRPEQVFQEQGEEREQIERVNCWRNDQTFQNKLQERVKETFGRIGKGG